MFWLLYASAWGTPLSCAQIAKAKRHSVQIEVVDLPGTVQYHRLPSRLLQYRSGDRFALGFTESELKTNVTLQTVIYEDEDRACVFFECGVL